MGRRRRRSRMPAFELIEQRELLSLVTNIMVSNHQAKNSALRFHPSLGQPTTAMNSGAVTNASGGASQGFAPSTTSIALPENQGPQGTNLVVAPQGTMTPHELRRELFGASFKGTYTIGPGRFSTEATHLFIRGTGRATSMLHSDIQIRLVVPTDPTVQNSGASAIFDRNLNSNTVLGFNLAAPHENLDSHGRPNHITSVSLDVNASSGVYDEGFSQGVMDIHYFPSRKRSPGVLEQGTAVVRIVGQIYSPNVDFILRNSDINP